jgi:hypothetical protein
MGMTNRMFEHFFIKITGSLIIPQKIMELQKSLIGIMDEAPRAALREQVEKEDSLQSKIIRELLSNTNISKREMMKHLSISEPILKKTLTLVKDVLWTYNAGHVKTPFDDVFVLRQLLLSGKVSSGTRYFNALLKETEIKQEWNKLDMIYTEGSRIAQITGNEKLIADITKARKRNSERLFNFTTVYSDIILEMIKLEGYMIRRPDNARYEAYLESLYQKALHLSHHLLIHNALHIRYLFYVRYNNDPLKVFEIITAQKKNVEKYKNVMSAMTYAIALNNHVNFLFLYKNFGAPDPFIKELNKVIAAGGNIAVTNFYYGMLEYCLFERKVNDVSKWLVKLEHIEDNSKFSQYRYIIFSIRAFIQKDLGAFKENFGNFYKEPSHLDFPDLEITLRLLETIILIYTKRHDLAMARLDALRIYVSRNVTKERHNDDRKILALLVKINENNKRVAKSLAELEQSVYRNVCFIASSIREWLL